MQLDGLDKLEDGGLSFGGDEIGDPNTQKPDMP